ncbi:MAG: prepilin-type N-terminal cleavage/methylation domain-containing protein, partial [Candidatus Absconditabacteria bacterium]
MAKSIRKLLKSFTLIELIIVIAVIAVLSASAFLTLSQWMSKGRDSRRITDLATLEKTIQLSFVSKESVIYPDPDPSIEIKTDDFGVLWYQGKFGPALTEYVGNLNKIPKDPKGGYYEYSLTKDKKYYMLTAFLENERNLSYLGKAFAQEEEQTYILTNYDGYIIKKIGLEVYLIKTQTLLVDPEKIDYTQPEYEVDLGEDILSANAPITAKAQVSTGNITTLLD